MKAVLKGFHQPELLMLSLRNKRVATYQVPFSQYLHSRLQRRCVQLALQPHPQGVLYAALSGSCCHSCRNCSCWYDSGAGLVPAP